MEYLTSKEIAELWGIGKCRVDRLAREGRIDGAMLFGKSWMIPRDAVKPIDGRTRQGKEASTVNSFRFPLFINSSEKSFVPPLTKEETKLRNGQVYFFACKYEEAMQIFAPLSESAENIYVRLCAVMFMAVLSSCYKSSIDWEFYYHKLNLELSQNFPHREEMSILVPWLNYFCGLYAAISEGLHFNPEYDYPPSVNFLNAFLSIFSLYSKKSGVNNAPEILKQYEILCHTSEQNGYLLQAQELHRILFISYYMSHQEEMMLYHLRKVISIAYEHNLLYDAADLASYYSDAFKKVIIEFPDEFAEKISEISEIMYEKFADFTSKYNLTDLYYCLSSNDYQLILYVLQGYTNKQIAEFTHYTPQTVSNKLSEIYDKLNINSRQELVALLYDGMTL